MLSRNFVIASESRQRADEAVLGIFALLTRTERFRALLLMVSALVNVALNILGMVGIVSFIHLVIASDPINGEGRTAQMLRAIGFVDANAALGVVGGAVLALVVFRGGYLLMHMYFQNVFCARVEQRVSAELLARIVAAPYDWLSTQNAAVLREIASGYVIEWSRIALRTTLQLASDLVFVGFTIALLVVASPMSGIAVSLTAVGLATLLLYFCQPPIRRNAERKRMAARRANVSMTEAIMGGRDVRMSQGGDFLVRMFARDYKIYSMADVFGREWQLVPRLGIEIIGSAAIIGVALAAIWAGAQREDVGALLALYAVIALRAIPVVSQIATSVAAIGGALPCVFELRKMMRLVPTRTAANPLEHKPIPNWKRISLVDVSYSYPGTKSPAVGPVNLTIARGMSLGIVGSSGAGKSTLIDVLVGLLEPTQGAVMIDGDRVGPESIEAWRARIGYVAQSPFLLDATLAENIEFGAPPIPDREGRCRASAEAAGLGSLVAALPKGLHTPIGDCGMQLSGGQRQRVAIARAFYRNADLLVLDEATSALDSVTEKEITAAIDELKGRLTLIIVAHRLSTVVRCDEIVLLEAGRIAAHGTHAQLLADSPAYRRLVEAQSFSFNGTLSEAAQ